MKVALYAGKHPGATWFALIGVWLTRLAQKGPYGIVTHCEAVLMENPDGTVDLGSSVASAGGVRIRRGVDLAADPGWFVVDVPQWDVVRARQWFADNLGASYDWRGAAATMLPGHAEGGHWFCSGAVLASVGFKTPSLFTPAHLAAIAFSLANAEPTRA